MRIVLKVIGFATKNSIQRLSKVAQMSKYLLALIKDDVSQSVAMNLRLRVDVAVATFIFITIFAKI